MILGPVHQSLRAATSALHQALERDAGVEARLRDADTRADVVERLWRFHRRCEAAIAPWTPALQAAGFRHDARSPRIRRCLDELGGVASPDPELASVTLPAALGWLYVAEGSALGGRVMRQAMVRDGIDLMGLDFLCDDARATGARWRDCLMALEVAGAEVRDRAADGAVAAFQHAGRMLIAPSWAGGTA